MPQISRSILSLASTIPPGESARVVTTSPTTFRPERLIVSPGSFPPSRTRRALTWPLVTIGDALDRARRGVAGLLRVDLHAVHERREYLGPAEAASVEAARRTGDDELSWDDDGDPYVVVRTPCSRRERLLATSGPLSRASRWLSRVRIRWQEAQLGTLVVRDIKISGQPMFAHAALIPADLVSALPMDLATCTPGNSISIEVENRNRRACRLTMVLIGTIAR